MNLLLAGLGVGSPLGLVGNSSPLQPIGLKRKHKSIEVHKTANPGLPSSFQYAYFPSLNSFFDGAKFAKLKDEFREEKCRLSVGLEI